MLGEVTILLNSLPGGPAKVWNEWRKAILPKKHLTQILPYTVYGMEAI